VESDRLLQEQIKQNENLRLDNEGLVNESQRLVQDHLRELSSLRATVDMIQEDFQSVGHCFNASEDSNCSRIAETYLFIPRAIQTQLCASSKDERMDLFGFTQCLLLGDINLATLDYLEFAWLNPIISTIFLLTLALALIGLICVLSFFVFCCCKRCRKGHCNCSKRRSANIGLPTRAHLLPSSAVLSRIREGTLFRGNWGPEDRGFDRGGIKLTSFRVPSGKTIPTAINTAVCAGINLLTRSKTCSNLFPSFYFLITSSDHALK
jgi:hypothetical protein